jgi:hypothetical protein
VAQAVLQARLLSARITGLHYHGRHTNGFFLVVLLMKPRASSMPDKYPTTELHPSLLVFDE